MKQIVQNIRDGSIEVLDVPTPPVTPGMVLVQVAFSVVSAGTERATVEFGQQNLVQKVRSRPDVINQVRAKIARDGLRATFAAVTSRLAGANALGYSCSGRVVAVGDGVADLRAGDLVACAGAGYASHAEFVSVPGNLVAPVPGNREDLLEAAAFTTIGAIALQGVRLANVSLGESVAVVGLGLLGQVLVMILRAAGCTVVGFDPNPQRVDRARQAGMDAGSASADEFRRQCAAATSGHGVDAVLIAAATKSDAPVEMAGDVCRGKGRVVVVGDVGLRVPRPQYFQKEIEFVVSRSYGPGRYDPTYEEEGLDYPYPYVRWTERRNMEAVLQMLAKGQLSSAALVTHRFPIDRAAEAYRTIGSDSTEPYLGVVLTYSSSSTPTARVERRDGVRPAGAPRATLGVGVVGAGAFLGAAILPCFQNVPGVSLRGVANSAGVSSHNAASRFGFAYAAASIDELVQDRDVDLILLGTPHNLHAPQVIAALNAGKHVFVEKPLCLTLGELDAIRQAAETQPRLGLMVGFNRRFSPLSAVVQKATRGRREPMIVHYRVDAGYLPRAHWTQTPAVGGGRLLGEGCHFIDWMYWCVGRPVLSVRAVSTPDAGRYNGDNLILELVFEDGSLGSLTYVASGSNQLGKERIEVFCDGQTIVLDDFRTVTVSRTGGAAAVTEKLRQVDKGHAEECRLVIEGLKGGTGMPIPRAEIFHVTEVTLLAEASRAGGGVAQTLNQGRPTP